MLPWRAPGFPNVAPWVDGWLTRVFYSLPLANNSMILSLPLPHRFSFKCHKDHISQCFLFYTKPPQVSISVVSVLRLLGVITDAYTSNNAILVAIQLEGANYRLYPEATSGTTCLRTWDKDLGVGSTWEVFLGISHEEVRRVTQGKEESRLYAHVITTCSYCRQQGSILLWTLWWPCRMVPWEMQKLEYLLADLWPVMVESSLGAWNPQHLEESWTWMNKLVKSLRRRDRETPLLGVYLGTIHQSRKGNSEVGQGAFKVGVHSIFYTDLSSHSRSLAGKHLPGLLPLLLRAYRIQLKLNSVA